MLFTKRRHIQLGLLSCHLHMFFCMDKYQYHFEKSQWKWQNWSGVKETNRTVFGGTCLLLPLGCWISVHFYKTWKKTHFVPLLFDWSDSRVIKYLVDFWLKLNTKHFFLYWRQNDVVLVIESVTKQLSEQFFISALVSFNELLPHSVEKYRSLPCKSLHYKNRISKICQVRF